MSRVLVNGDVAWDRNRLPTEQEAMKILGVYIKDEINPEAAIALSAGIDVVCDGTRFTVELNGEGK